MEMLKNKSNLLFLLPFFLGFWLFFNHERATAQQTARGIFITDSDATAAPTVVLTVYAIDGQGNAVTLAAGDVVVEHDGIPVTNVTIGDPREIGTFTIFLLDTPGGVAAQIPTIQDAIQRYATEATMKQEVDYVAIYGIGELAATPIMQTDTFHNSVLNVFASPLTPTSGATALVDSTMNLLNNIDTLKPDAKMVAHIVIFSDGTDIVSTQFQKGDLPTRAAELGVPIHTVWLDNQSITAANKEAGREYMAQLASGTLGISNTLTTADNLQPLWNAIAGFRNQTTVQYTLDSADGGDHNVAISLAQSPEAKDQTVVNFPANAPSITINIPPEERELTLKDLSQPVKLSFSTTLSWLDGVDRQVTTAQLLVNGIVVQQVDPGQLDRVEADITNFRVGENRIQIAVVDDQGARATSPEIILTITQGEEDIIPESVDSGGGGGLFSGFSLRTGGLAVAGGGCFLVLLVGFLIIALTIAGRRSRLLQSLGIVNLLYYVPFLRPYVARVYDIERQAGHAREMGRSARRYTPDVIGTEKSKKAGAATYAYLEVMESTTRMPGKIDLTDIEMHIGRSPNQATVAFKDDRTVSRIHATITQEGKDYRIFDEQSTSGTYVNEQHVPDYGLQLKDGDEIRLGAVRLRFRQP